jgi:hypothetical protein
MGVRRGLGVRSGAVAAAVVLGGWSSAAAQGSGVAVGVEREVERMAGAQAYWPGFDPLGIPLAVYDGQQTYLFRHPAQPPGFVVVQGAVPAMQAYAGRHPAVTSNSSAELGGVMTATLLVDGASAGRPPTELAAVALHESFHVYQRSHHAGWSGNEGDLVIYPVQNADLLALRRLESDALVRALSNTENAGAACWARVALSYRRERFAAMDSAFPRYERLTELNEGLATYVQLRAGGETGVTIPAAEYPPAAIRLRAYTVGPALGLLLDRLSPGWQLSLERNDQQTLDAMLDAAVNSPGVAPSTPCAFTAVEVATRKREARLDVAEVVAGWGERQRAFDARPGWRVLIQSATGRPLWPQGFDPLNIERVEGGLVHTRFLRLGNDAGQLTAIDEAGADIEARTEGVGPHPLFNGIAWVEIAGLAKPTVDRAPGHLVLRAPGFTADFKDATVQESGQQLLVQLK